jgi:hypothetical protein
MMKGTLGAADRSSRRGGGREAVLSLNGLRKRGGRLRASRKQACDGNSIRSSALPDAVEVLGELGTGAQAPSGVSVSPTGKPTSLRQKVSKLDGLG